VLAMCPVSEKQEMLQIFSKEIPRKTFTWKTEKKMGLGIKLTA